MGEVLRHYEDKEPVIIVGFLPPFYPHRTNLRESSRELGIVRAVEELADEAKESHGETLKVNEHFIAISDLSYVGFHGTREDILPLTENTPGWGKVYNLPVEALLKLNIPVLNIGPSGRDAHNFTERLHLPYYLGAYPKLLESLIERLSLIP
jgi:arginine utilization protein RocB